MKGLFSAKCILVLLALASCNADYEYCSYPCYFVFDNSKHLDATLSSALNSSSPGVFCCITQSTKSGVTYINFSNNQGLSSSQAKNAVDQKYTYVLGLNNGIIVGFGNLDNPATLYAYDRQCPNCANSTSAYSPKYPLTMSSDGKASCSKCGRVYDLNNNGIIVSGTAGDKLWRYHVTCTGPIGVLIVNN
jgi:hypothetical protein